MLSRLVETLGIGTMSIRLSDGRVVDASHAQAHALGWRREDVIGRPAIEIGVVPDGDRPYVTSVAPGTRSDLDLMAYAASLASVNYAAYVVFDARGLRDQAEAAERALAAWTASANALG